ncbi:hypothetical protein F5Y07DRAFT_202649 [Xylaria sp. FL0933]|nr:hypothetical protein F5Y07DRAFT_202649 [Xylaria sp. FL0933]
MYVCTLCTAWPVLTLSHTDRSEWNTAAWISCGTGGKTLTPSLPPLAFWGGGLTTNLPTNCSTKVPTTTKIDADSESAGFEKGSSTEIESRPTSPFFGSLLGNNGRSEHSRPPLYLPTYLPTYLSSNLLTYIFSRLACGCMDVYLSVHIKLAGRLLFSSCSHRALQVRGTNKHKTVRL